MHKLHPTQRFLVRFAVLTLALGFVTAAVADTIYLKNGRMIRTSTVRVEGDQIHFIQYGGKVSLPMSLVDRIVEDANTEPAATPPPAVPVADPAATPDPNAPADPEEDVPEEQTREFWQDRVRANEAEKEQVRLQIEDLRRTERAFLFSHRSTAETRASIEAAEARLDELDQETSDLQADARTQGVPPGWLRLAPGGGGGPGGPGGSGG